MSFDEKNQIVVLKDTQFSDVYSLLEFMYKGEISVPQVMIFAIGIPLVVRHFYDFRTN